jgi:hypothetical protein
LAVPTTAGEVGEPPVGYGTALGVVMVVVFVAARAKLAHVIRVLFAKWITKERFPKKAPMPSTVEAKSSL